MRLATENILVVEELSGTIKKLAYLKGMINIAKDCLNNWVSEAELDMAKAHIMTAIDLISMLAGAFSGNRASFYESLTSYPQNTFYSLYDLKDKLTEIHSDFSTTKLIYSETIKSINPLWSSIDENLTKIGTEITNAINSHKL